MTNALHGTTHTLDHRLMGKLVLKQKIVIDKCMWDSITLQGSSQGSACGTQSLCKVRPKVVHVGLNHFARFVPR